MTRSRRHTPIVGICGDGAGPYKRQRARQERARLRVLMAGGRADEADRELAPWDEWSCDRDGKTWVGGRWGEDHPDWMRK